MGTSILNDGGNLEHFVLGDTTWVIVYGQVVSRLISSMVD